MGKITANDGILKIKSLLKEHIEKTTNTNFYNELIPYINTGIEPLDLILGEQGIPIGRVTQIIGRPGSGKSALAINIMANIQKQDPNAICFYFDAERSTDILRLKNLGVRDYENVLLVDFTLEEFYETIMSIIEYKKKIELDLNKLQKTAKKKLTDKDKETMELYENFLKSHVVIVLDSMPFTKPKKLLEVDDPSQITGLQARINQHYLQKILDDLVKYNIVLIILNQLRDNIQMGFIKKSGDLKALGTEKTIPGGKYLKYATFTMLYLIERGSIKRNTYGFDGNMVEITTWKCKSFTPYLSIISPFSFIYGYDNFYSKLYFLIDKKYIKSSGSVYKFKYYMNGEKGFYFKNAKKMYEENEEFKEAFDKIWKDAKNDFVYEYRDVFLSQNKKELVEEVISNEENIKKHEDVNITCEADLSTDFVESIEVEEDV